MSDTSGPAGPTRPREDVGGGRATPIDQSMIARAIGQLGAIMRGMGRQAGTIADPATRRVEPALQDVPSRTQSEDPRHPWFGPGRPMPPMAPPGAAVGRQWDYPTNYNMQQRPRPLEPTTFEQLRQLADGYDLLRLCIETRKDQLSKIPWKIVPKKKVGQTARQAPDARCEELTRFFQMPDRELNWNGWLRAIMEEMFVTDAVTLYGRKNRGGGMYAVERIDGATIKRVISEDGRAPLPPFAAYQQILKGMPAVDYTIEEMIYAPRNVRTHKVFGYSPVEQIIMTVNIALRRQISQLHFYTEGNIPEALAGVPESWTPQQIGEFQTYWDSIMEGNTAARRHMKFVPGGMDPQFLRSGENLMDQFDEWLARVVCYAFSLPPLPFVKQVNRAVAETAQEASLEEGLEPIMKWVKDLIDLIVVKWWGWYDIEFSWDDDEIPGPEEMVGINTAYVEKGIKSIDEARMDLGLDPWGIGPIIFGIGPNGFAFVEDLKDPAKRDLISGVSQLQNPMVAPGMPGALPGEDPLAGVPPEVMDSIGMGPGAPGVARTADAGGPTMLDGIPPEILARIGMKPNTPKDKQREFINKALRAMSKGDLVPIDEEPIEERLTKMADTVAQMVLNRLRGADEMFKREPAPPPLPPPEPVVVNLPAAPPTPTTVRRAEFTRDAEGKVTGAVIIEEPIA